MPTYSYQCCDCNKKFEMFFYIRDYISSPECPKCKSSKTNRSYIDDVSTQFSSVKKSDTELKTIGDLANRNRDRLSDDQKFELDKKHNAYKEEQQTKPLPKGMTRLKKQPKTKWTQS